MRMFKPINEWILVRQMDEPKDPGASPVIIPETSAPEFMYGEIVDLGEGAVTPNGSRVPPAVKKGDQVYFTARGSQEIRDLKIWKMTERAIVGIVESTDADLVPMA